jgi:nickel-dependent lactate racemase
MVSGSADRICLVVPDSTRQAHLKEVLPVILRNIRHTGRIVDIIAATGLHRPHSAAELKELVGSSVFKRCRVMSHCQRKSSLIHLGRTRSGVPIVLNKRVLQYDLIVSVGLIEPHLYAGYSGGAKTVAVGLAGKETVDATHGVRFLSDPDTGIGSIRRNPFQLALWEIAQKAPVRFAVNVINDPSGRAVAAFAGPVKAVFEAGCRFSKRIYEVGAGCAADVVICGVGNPKDVNLYQASRAMNYVLDSGSPVLKKGGVLIIAAELRDGAGKSRTERLFYETLKNIDSPREFLSSVMKRGCVAGEHRAYMVARALIDYKIVFVSRRKGPLFRGLPIKCFGDIESAVRYSAGITGPSARIWIIPKALSTIARVRRERR